jgi:hypothetical protein
MRNTNYQWVSVKSLFIMTRETQPRTSPNKRMSFWTKRFISTALCPNQQCGLLAPLTVRALTATGKNGGGVPENYPIAGADSAFCRDRINLFTNRRNRRRRKTTSFGMLAN